MEDILGSINKPDEPKDDKKDEEKKE